MSLFKLLPNPSDPLETLGPLHGEIEGETLLAVLFSPPIDESPYFFPLSRLLRELFDWSQPA